MDYTNSLFLSELSSQNPAILKEFQDFCIQNCIVCFSKNGHKSGTKISAYFNGTIYDFSIFWEGEISEKITRCIGKDLNKAVDFAATAVSLSLINKINNLYAMEQSETFNGFDYYLSNDIKESTNIFSDLPKIEISGILCERENNSIRKRVGIKKRRLIKHKNNCVYISIIEFSRPQSFLEIV
ncbi:hypothetical protein SDC9_60371 [bioreactor metagenome]|uniref:Uncharacterized protein n=1 Tax=bioreactor metagenome TaxID=1076179 RepID=A0A644XE28_9ZZZZ